MALFQVLLFLVRVSEFCRISNDSSEYLLCDVSFWGYLKIPQHQWLRPSKLPCSSSLLHSVKLTYWRRTWSTQSPNCTQWCWWIDRETFCEPHTLIFILHGLILERPEWKDYPFCKDLQRFCLLLSPLLTKLRTLPGD